MRQTPPDRPLRNSEAAGPVMGPDQWISLVWSADEDPVVQPLRLDELELALDVRSGEHEHDPAVLTVVLEHTLGQHRPVARATPDHAMQTNVDAAVVIERVAGVRAPCMCAEGALEAARIVGIQEDVVALGVRPEQGIVALRGEREWGSALPATDHLG